MEVVSGSGFTLRWLHVAWLSFALVVIACALLAIHSRWRREAFESHCQGNLTGIGCGMGWHQERYEHLPPAHVLGADGSRWHSWRVIGSDEWGPPLPRSYDYTEPWNGPRNSQLADHRPDFYACASDPNTRRNRRLTSYFVVEGAETAFPGAATTSLTKIQERKGLANTVLVVEAAGQDIEWLEPRDLLYDEMSFAVNDAGRPSIASAHAHGPYACMADGRVRSLSGVAPEILQAMLTIQPTGDVKGATQSPAPARSR